MRNALVRFGRSRMRNALVRFGKRLSGMGFLEDENKRDTALHSPFQPGHFENSNEIKDIFPKI
uniref:Uncharacterized protein n=1 Tax=Setaria digitata TaxID=48799 RepID=A0A915Q6T8_9BILA